MKESEIRFIQIKINRFLFQYLNYEKKLIKEIVYMIH